MSDYVHTGRRSKMLTEHRTIEYRLMFGACYLLSSCGSDHHATDAVAQARSLRSRPHSGIDFQGSQQRRQRLGGLVVHGFVTGFRPAVPGGKLPYLTRSGIRCRPRSGGERPQGHY